MLEKSVTAKFIFWIIFGVALGFNLTWFTFWVVKLYKGPKKTKAPDGKTGRSA